ncbi:MAG: N-acetyl-gamma-glutamyl-phosphate reductase [Planctomycetota bacterium]
MSESVFSTDHDSIRVAIVGASGYTAVEAARWIARHPAATVSVATSRSEIGKRFDAVHRSLLGQTDVVLSKLDPAVIAEHADVAFCCLPHGASAETVRQLVDAGLRVVDFSADFRLSDLATYQSWYGVTHPWPERFGKVVYGMPEFFREQIAGADIVANPGCYPTSAILPLAPLIGEDLIEPTDIIIDAKSGVSGAGRSAKLGTLFCETNESIAAYAVGTHRHGPEIDDLVTRISGVPCEAIFTPHLTPMIRGILSTIYVRPKLRSIDDAKSLLRETYRDFPMIRIVDHLPATAEVSGSNAVHITIASSRDRWVIVSVIDNLAKGASGAAVQNMNVMFGLAPDLGLS